MVHLICVDEVLDVLSVVREEFFAVAGADFKERAVDQFVAKFNAAVEFGVGCSARRRAVFLPIPGSFESSPTVFSSNDELKD